MLNLRRVTVVMLVLLMTVMVSDCGKGIAENTETNGESKMSESGKKRDKRITPEQVGISSADIKSFLKELKSAGLNMHSMLIMKNGEIIAEGYADGYDKYTLQRMYSVSKSFVGMAIGLLADEGKISLDGRAIDYFKSNPVYASAVANADEKIKKATVRDLLKMTSPYDKGSSYNGATDKDWVMTFLTNSNHYKLKKPGMRYRYDTGGTHLLGAIVEEITGKTFLEYLQEKALDEIGFSKNAWCVKAPEGFAWGGSGVMCTTRDLARFASLVMHGGAYNGKQLLPGDYVSESTKKQVDNSIEMNGAQPYASHFYASGYGYQIWKTDYTGRSFAFLGMGDQIAICIPEDDLLFACTADNQGKTDSRVKIFELFDSNILKKQSDGPLLEDERSLYEMDAALSGMKLCVQNGERYSPIAGKINGVTFTDPSNSNITGFKLTFEGDRGIFDYTTPRGKKQLIFGLCKNISCTLDEPQYSGATISEGNGVGYKAACSGAWKGNSFILYVQIVDDYLGNMRLEFEFTDERNVKLTGTKNAEWFLDEYKISGVSYFGK